MKRTFWPNVCVGAMFQIRYILRHACGLALNQNAHFKTIHGKIDLFRPWQMKKKAFLLISIVIGVGLIVSGCSDEPPIEKSVAVAKSSEPAYEGTIVAVGNSLTAGLGIPEDQAYPAQLAHRLRADGKNYQVINAGVSGETSSGALSRIEWVISSLSPDIVILVTGANDGLRGLDPELLKTNLDRLVGLLTENNIQVILAGMKMLPNLGPEYTRAFSEIYPQIAEKYDVILIPFFLDGVAGQADLNQADKLHPTAKGYARIVETIYPFVTKAIERHKDR